MPEQNPDFLERLNAPNPELTAFSNLLLLNPSNRAFVNGQTARLVIDGSGRYREVIICFAITMLLFGTAAYVKLFVDKPFDAPLCLFSSAFIFLILTLLGTINITARWRRALYLSQHGQLLRGEIVQW